MITGHYFSGFSRSLFLDLDPTISFFALSKKKFLGRSLFLFVKCKLTTFTARFKKFDRAFSWLAAFLEFRFPTILLIC